MTDSTYTTISGDTWDMVAYKALGACEHTAKLMEANPRYVDVVVFTAGTVLLLPEIEPGPLPTMPPWRQ